MSRNGTARLNARRDANEAHLKGHIQTHGYTVMQVSGKGLPDWVAMIAGYDRTDPETGAFRHHVSERKWLVDVKTRDGYFKPAQIAQWTAWLTKGIHVYVVRTPEDIDAMLRGDLEPWEPSDAAPARTPKPHKPGLSKATKHGELCRMDHCLTSKAKGSTWCTKHGPKRPDTKRDIRTRLGTPVRKAYASHGSPAIAAETFAPWPDNGCPCPTCASIRAGGGVPSGPTHR